MLVFRCPKCQTELSADATQVGQLVRCPQCLVTLRVPQAVAPPPAQGAPVSQTEKQASLPRMSAHNDSATPNEGPDDDRDDGTIAVAPPQVTTAPTRTMTPMRSPGGGRRYGFNCVYCSSRLEATESSGGQEGTCPTCGNTIVIPILDRYGRLIDPITKEIIKQDPHPVHAYAAAGERAPRILRQDNGNQVIQCPRCGSLSSINSNNCKSCGMPFTMEGTTLEAAGGSNGFCVASLVLGIIGLPIGCSIIIPLLALIFGIVGYNQVSNSGSEGAGKGMAIAGMVCGGVGLCWGMWADFIR